MEPFRPLIADQAVLTGLNTGQLKPDDATSGGAGFQLAEAGRRKLKAGDTLKFEATIPDK